MNSTLKLGPKLSMPAEAVTETFGILAVRGAGKTNTARVLAEEMFRARLPFVAIDPVGSWWGLRSSRSGKQPGLEVAIFGGRHGDVPLERTGGKLLAELIVRERIPCIVDVSDFDSEAAKKQFLLDFARRLYQKNEDPLHLFLEEADDYIPQRPQQDETQLLRAWENIVRRGRSRGLGMTLITQRSASVNKSVLTQVQTLIAMRTTGPQDRAAIEAWVKYHAQGSEILSSLPELDDGEAWVWSPRFLSDTRRVRFRLSNTLDSGATPKLRKRKTAARLADVDLEGVRKQMASTIERAKEEDPKELRKRIRELEAQLKKKPTAEKPNEVRVEVPVFRKEDRKQLDRIERGSQELEVLISKLIGRVESLGVRPPSPTARKRSDAQKPPRSRPEAPRAPEEPSGGESVGKCAHGLLKALAQHGDLSLKQAAIIAGYSAKSGSVRNAAGELRGHGYVAGSNAKMSIQPAGSEVVSGFEPLPTGPELAAVWYGQLNQCASAILKVVVEAYPNAVPLDVAAHSAGYSETSGSVRNAAGRLRTLELVVGSNAGMTAHERLSR